MLTGQPPLLTSLIINSEFFSKGNKSFHPASVRLDSFCKKFEKFVVVENQSFCPGRSSYLGLGEKNLLL